MSAAVQRTGNGESAGRHGGRPRVASRDRLLQHYLRFVLPRESGPLRDRLRRGLVERALKTSNPDHLMSVEDICARIARLTGLPSYPRALVAGTLKELIKAGRVRLSGASEKGRDLYRLTASRFVELEQASCDSDELDSAVKAIVISRVAAHHGELTSDEKQILERAFFEFVGTLLRGLGHRCAEQLLQHRSLTSVSEGAEMRSELERALGGLSSELQKAAWKAFREVLVDPPEAAKNYLYGVGQSYYMIGLLDLDPELQSTQRLRFEQTILYLDTNLIVAALLPEHDSSEAALSLIGLCRALGLHLCYSDSTADEIERLIAAADADYAAYPPIDLHAASEVARLVDNPFLSAWLTSWPESQLNWNQFRVRVGAWRAVLDHLGVTPDSSVDEAVIDEGRVRALKSELSRSVSGGTPRARRDHTSKLPRAAEHDARMLLGVQALVARDEEQTHPFGTRYWFVTLDRQLADVARQQLAATSPHVCMVADEWIAYISPFASPDLSESQAVDVFASLLGSRFFRAVGESLSLRDLQPFTAPALRELTKGLTPDEIAQAVSDAHAHGVRRTLSGQQRDPQQALSRYAKQIDRHLAAKRASGELVAVDDVQRLVEAERHKSRALKAEVSAKQQEIDGLRASLRAADVYRRTSAAYLVTAFQRRLEAWYRATCAWVFSHKIRAAAILSAVVAALTYRAHRGDGALVAALIVVATLMLSVEPRKAVRNLKAWLGKGENS